MTTKTILASVAKATFALATVVMMSAAFTACSSDKDDGGSSILPEAAPQTVTIDGVEKTVVRTEHIVRPNGNYEISLYLDNSGFEVVRMVMNKERHMYVDIDLTKKEEKTDEVYWTFEYKSGSTKLAGMSASSDPKSNGKRTFITGTLHASVNDGGKVDFMLKNGRVLDENDEQRTITINYSGETQMPDANSLIINGSNQKILKAEYKRNIYNRYTLLLYFSTDGQKVVEINLNGDKHFGPNINLAKTESEEIPFKKGGNWNVEFSELNSSNSLGASGSPRDERTFNSGNLVVTGDPGRGVSIRIENVSTYSKYEEVGNTLSLRYSGAMTFIPEEPQPDPKPNTFTLDKYNEYSIQLVEYEELGQNRYKFNLYTSTAKDQYVTFYLDESLHPGQDIDLTKKESKHDADYWLIDIYDEGSKLMAKASGNPNDNIQVFHTGTLSVRGNHYNELELTLKSGTLKDVNGDRRVITLHYKGKAIHKPLPPARQGYVTIDGVDKKILRAESRELDKGTYYIDLILSTNGKERINMVLNQNKHFNKNFDLSKAESYDGVDNYTINYFDANDKQVIYTNGNVSNFNTGILEVYNSVPKPGYTPVIKIENGRVRDTDGKVRTLTMYCKNRFTEAVLPDAPRGYVVLDGIKKPIVKAEYTRSRRYNEYWLHFYLDNAGSEVLRIDISKYLHTNKVTNLTYKETQHDGYPYWSVLYAKNNRWYIKTSGDPTDANLNTCLAGKLNIEGRINKSIYVDLSNGFVRNELKLLHTLTLRYLGKLTESANSEKFVEYIDLGLPSGLKWGTRNLGALDPEDVGDYYVWGETQSKTEFTWENFKWQGGFSSHGLPVASKYTKEKQRLDPADDAATVNLGIEYRMPDPLEIVELIDKCRWTWTTLNGANGYQILGPNGNTIFLPAGGYCSEKEKYNNTVEGHYNSREVHVYPASSIGVKFSKNKIECRTKKGIWGYPDEYQFMAMQWGLPVRAVRP